MKSKVRVFFEHQYHDIRHRNEILEAKQYLAEVLSEVHSVEFSLALQWIKSLHFFNQRDSIRRIGFMLEIPVSADYWNQGAVDSMVEMKKDKIDLPWRLSIVLVSRHLGQFFRFEFAADGSISRQKVSEDYERIFSYSMLGKSKGKLKKT